MRIKRKLDMDRYETMLRDLETMYKNDEISEQTYNEMKPKYEEKLKELEESYFEEEELVLDLGELEKLSVLGESIGERVEEAVSRAMEKVQMIAKDIPYYEGHGKRHTKDAVYEGTFDSNHVRIDFDTVNGNIDVKKWDKDTYKVVVTKKVRASSEEEAEEKLASISEEFQHQKNGEETLKLKTSEKMETVAISAYLPEKCKGGVLPLRNNTIVYDLDLNSVNGRVTVAWMNTEKVKVKTVNGRICFETLKSDDIHAETENGRILLEAVSGKTVSLSTENGRIELLDATGDNLEASTENGSVRGKLSFSAATLETENGSLNIAPKGKGDYTMKTDMGRVKITVDRTLPYKIEAKTGMGHIRVAPDLEVSHKEKHRITVKSKDFDEGGESLSVEAKTDMGSIRIL